MTVLETKRGAGAERRHPRSPLRNKSKYRKADAASAWLLLAPALVLFIVFIIVPTIVGVGLSFYEWNFFDTPTFIGFTNFVKLATDPAAWASLGISLLFVLLGVIPTIAIGFMLAVLINANMPGVGVLRVLYFVPVVLSVAVWWAARSPAHTAGLGGRQGDGAWLASAPVRVAAVVLTLAVAAGSVVDVYRIGDSGAKAAWHNSYAKTASGDRD